MFLKRLLCAVTAAAFLFTALAAGNFPPEYVDWSFAGDFIFFHDNSFTANDAATLKYEPKLRNTAGKKAAISETAYDLNKIFGYTFPKSGRVALAVNQIELKKPGRIQLGVGCDWQVTVFIDGKQVFSTLELGGNGSAPAKKDNHIIDVKLAEGRHTLSCWLWSGSTTWSFAAGKNPYTKVIYPAPELKYGPYLTDVSSKDAVISFVTTAPAPCGVAIRKAGEKNSRFFWNHDGHQISRNKRIHRINVRGLEADTTYEYKLVTLVRPENKLQYFGNGYRMTTGAANFKPFKIFVTGDLQYLPEKQSSILKKYMSTKQAERSQFFISLGDSSGDFHTFEKTMFDVVLKHVLAQSCHQKNILMVRGNHEYRGSETHLFNDYFSMKNNRTYGIYYYNNVAFIVLDCGNAQKRSMANTRHYAAYDLPELLLEEQREYFVQAVKDPAYKNAKYKVVLAHSAVYGGANGPIEKYAGRIIKNIIDENDIILWLAGHIHRYRRIAPGEKGYYGFSPFSSQKEYIQGNPPFTTVIIDGPGAVKPHSAHTVEFLKDGIRVESFFEDGKVFDSFSITPDGKIINSSPGKELTFFEPENE